MYENIGKKIKGLAWATFIIGAAASVIVAIIFFSNASDVYLEEFKSVYITTGVLWLLIGPIVSWVSSWMLYGFGELIDKVTDIEINTRNKEIDGTDYEDDYDYLPTIEKVDR